MALSRGFCFAALVTTLLGATALIADVNAQPYPFETKVIDLQNNARAAHGLPPQGFDYRLYNDACKHSQLQAQYRTMSHLLPGEGEIGDRTSIPGNEWVKLLENVGVGGVPCDASSLFGAWMLSPLHYANIMSSANAVAVCTAPGSDNKCYWTVSFAQLTGSPKASPPPTTPTPGSINVPKPLQFFPLDAPYRLFDTRVTADPIVGDTARRFSTAGVIPDSAAAFSATLQAVDPVATGYLTVYPSSASRPLASCINYQPGLVVSASLYSSVAQGGSFDVYAFKTAHVLVDITGYFAPESNGLWFTPLPPARVFDSREEGPTITSDQARQFVGRAGIPNTAAAVSYTAAMVNHAANGYLTVWAQGPRPVVTAGLYNRGAIGETAGVAKVGDDGKIRFFGQLTIDLALDVDGYFSSSGSLGFVPLLTPHRLLDSRDTSFHGAGTFTLQVTGPFVPGNAAVLVCTATAVGANAGFGFATIYPYGGDKPLASQLQFNPSAVQTVMALALNVPIGAEGKINIFLSIPGDIIIDAVGYYMPRSAAVSVRMESADPVINSSSSSGSPAPQLSTAAVAAIVVAVVILCAALIGVVVFFVMRSKAEREAYKNMIVSS